MLIAYDISLLKVGCPILQAWLGGSPMASNRFHSEDWLIAPTPDLKLYEVSEDQLEQLITKTEAR